jgi:hypothetical protein
VRIDDLEVEKIKQTFFNRKTSYGLQIFPQKAFSLMEMATRARKVRYADNFGTKFDIEAFN